MKTLFGKLFIAGAVLTLSLSSCGQRGNVQGDVAGELAQPVAITELVSNPMDYGDKFVRIEGIIDHMCRTSGEKMRVREDGSDLSIQVMLGEKASEFNVEMEGSYVVVEGILKYSVANKDALGEDEHGHADGEDHDCDTEKAVAEALIAKGLDPSIKAFINISSYELK